MRKTLKTLTVMLLIIAICVTLTLPCAAARLLEISPRWIALCDIATAFEFYGNVGEVAGTATKDSDAAGMNGVIVVYEYQDGEWVYFDSMTGRNIRNSMFISFEFEGESGVDYKMEFIVSVLGGVDGMEVIEEVIDERYATCP